MLKDRARTAGDIGERPGEEGPAGDPLPLIERIGDALGGGASGLHRLGEHVDGTELVKPRGDVEHGFLVADAWRGLVPLHPLVEACTAVDADPGRWDQVARWRDRHVDGAAVVVGTARPVGRAERAEVWLRAAGAA